MGANSTGTPTSLGIPTLNPAQDILKADGVNEIVQAIDSLIAIKAIIGKEIGYDQITGTVNITSTNFAAPSTVITCAAHTFDGSPVMVEVFFPEAITPSPNGNFLAFSLMESGAVIAAIMVLASPGSGSSGISAPCGRFRFSPSAGSHSYVIGGAATATTGTPQVACGTGTGGANSPGFVRFTRV